LYAHTPIVGVWDDHDYGFNNEGINFRQKHTTRELWLDFIDEPVNSERRLQRGTAIYQDYYLRKTVKGQQITVHLILLDNRFWFDYPDRLGQDQWSWLENALAREEATITVIGAGIQILPYSFTFGLQETFEWHNKSRIYRLLRKHRIQAVFISGDVHFA
jgi:alkaline phosphatase D